MFKNYKFELISTEQRKKKLDEIAMKCQSLVSKKQISSSLFAKINSVLPNKNEYWINGALFIKDDDEEFIKYINEDFGKLRLVL